MAIEILFHGYTVVMPWLYHGYVMVILTVVRVTEPSSIYIRLEVVALGVRLALARSGSKPPPFPGLLPLQIHKYTSVNILL